MSNASLQIWLRDLGSLISRSLQLNEESSFSHVLGTAQNLSDPSLLRVRDRLFHAVLERFLDLSKNQQGPRDVLVSVEVLYRRKFAEEDLTMEDWLAAATLARRHSTVFGGSYRLFSMLANHLAMAQWALFPESYEETAQNDYEAVSQSLGSDYGSGAFMGTHATMIAMMEGRDVWAVGADLYARRPEGKLAFFVELAVSLESEIIQEVHRLSSGQPKP